MRELDHFDRILRANGYGECQMDCCAQELELFLRNATDGPEIRKTMTLSGSSLFQIASKSDVFSPAQRKVLPKMASHHC